MKSLLAILCILLPSIVYAGGVDNHVALDGLRSISIVCDVNVGEPDLLLRRLELIDETYSQLLDASVAPTVVVAFRGEASRYVTRGNGYVPADAVKVKQEIEQLLAQFRRNGFRLEQCAIAAKTLNIDPADILPGVELVQNGYVSIVAYQTRGYALLPMD